ncbi:sodium:solute symporter family protein [Halorubellus sp. PRR65]|uniref:sodium:solute symporter family protein n=1 Tax=Halorubellus sp. PRR65 TaxID=3098148 RepID=UPI002B25A54B|nr:sodium:solute symporter family protein [Halorubellus sp. PRR65]
MPRDSPSDGDGPTGAANGSTGADDGSADAGDRSPDVAADGGPSNRPSVSGDVKRFFVGDRDVGASVGAASLAATQMSAGTLVGTVGIHYAVGVSFLAIWPGIWLGWLVSMYLVAPQLRAFAGMTVPDFVADRFDDDGANGARSRALVATAIAVVYLVYTAAQYVAGAVVLESVLGIPRLYGALAIVAVALAYTSTGGIRASIVTDALQMALMVVALAVAVVVGVHHVGGVGELLDGVRTVDATLLEWGMAPTRILGFALAFGLGMTVAPYEVSRIYAMRDPDTVTSAIRRSIVLQAFVAGCIAVLGLVARVAFPELANPDTAVAELAMSLFGPLAGGLLLLAVLAAVLSTIDSVLLVSSSALAYDLYAAVFRPTGGFDRLESVDDVLVATRAATALAAVVPLAFVVRPSLLGGLVQLIVALYAALLAGALFAPILLGLHWERTTTVGALAGVLTGLGAVVTWHVLADATAVLGPVLATVPPVVVGVATSTATVVLASALEHAAETEPTTVDV